MSLRWARFDVGFLRNPKIRSVRLNNGGAEAILLWQECICYAVEHKQDGWIPGWLPKDLGYKPRHVDALVSHGLLHPVQPIPELGMTEEGWLIHDFLQYQRSKSYWDGLSEQRRAAIEARWNKR